MNSRKTRILLTYVLFFRDTPSRPLRHGCLVALAAGALISLSSTAFAQTWPAKPIRIVCSLPPGTLPDLFARTYGEHLAQQLGQPIVVENKPGANGIVAAQAVKGAEADGHTLLMTASSTLIHNRVLYKRLPYDPDNDFVFISSMSAGPIILAAQASTKAENLQDLVAYARRNDVNIATWGPGSAAHVAIAELNKHFGLTMKPVHYRGPQMWHDFSSGVLQGAMSPYNTAMGTMQTGAGRIVAVWPTRSSKLPGVATFQEQGVSAPSFPLKGYVGLLGPRGIPEPIVERLSSLMVAAGKTERVRKVLDAMGIDEAAQDHVAFRRLHDYEAPLVVERVRSLGLTPE